MKRAEFCTRAVYALAEKNMSEPLRFHYEVDGQDFTSAGAASVDVKKKLRLLGLSPESVRRV